MTVYEINYVADTNGFAYIPAKHLRGALISLPLYIGEEMFDNSLFEIGKIAIQNCKSVKEAIGFSEYITKNCLNCRDFKILSIAEFEEKSKLYENFSEE